VSEQVPEALAMVIARIEPPSDSAHALPSDITGVLADLAGWWHSLVPDAPVRAAELACAGADTVDEAVARGLAATDGAVDSGANLLVPRVAVRDDVAARAVIGLLARKEASAVVEQTPGMTDRQWMDRCAQVRDRMAEAVDLRGDPLALVESLGGLAIASTAAALLGASARRTPCLIDGTDELAAALVADRLGHRARTWWRVASDSPDRGRTAALERVDLQSALPLQLTDDAARGSQAAIAVLGLLE
jgi:nicotinate-nucleotide--dimethylbenzimidazole phosphoribosyltransferase